MCVTQSEPTQNLMTHINTTQAVLRLGTLSFLSQDKSTQSSGLSLEFVEPLFWNIPQVANLMMTALI